MLADHLRVLPGVEVDGQQVETVVTITVQRVVGGLVELIHLHADAVWTLPMDER
ncbi:MAG: hypothetical protein PUC85_04140 [bacterium]|nr:hypothetical protein [bacterium]